MAPMSWQAKSAVVHSGRFSLRMAMRSPRVTPQLCKARATDIAVKLPGGDGHPLNGLPLQHDAIAAALDQCIKDVVQGGQAHCARPTPGVHRRSASGERASAMVTAGKQ